MITMQYHRYLGTVGVYTHTPQLYRTLLRCTVEPVTAACDAGRCRGESRIQNSIAWWGARIFFLDLQMGQGAVLSAGFLFTILDVETDWAGYS